MREIKFRIWYKPTKKYVTMSQEDWSYGKGPVKYKDSGDFLAISHDGFLCHEGYGNGAANVEDSENYVVQQYTGLKDKNGQEIYEGDLLTYADNTTPEQIFEVKFLDERGTFVFRELYNPTFEGSDLPGWDDVILGQNAWDGWEIADAAKVIGNIFEGVDK